MSVARLTLSRVDTNEDLGFVTELAAMMEAIKVVEAHRCPNLATDCRSDVSTRRHIEDIARQGWTPVI